MGALENHHNILTVLLFGIIALFLIHVKTLPGEAVGGQAILMPDSPDYVVIAETMIENPPCKDDYDGPFIKATTAGYEDRCEDEHKLIEYSCKDGKLFELIGICGTGCEQGHCRLP